MYYLNWLRLPYQNHIHQGVFVMQEVSKRFRTAHAVVQTGNPAENSRQAVRQIYNAFAGFDAGMIVFFTATDYDPRVLAAELHDAFPGVVTLGCTSAGEGIDDRILNSSVVAMAYSHDVFDYCEFALVVKDAALVRESGRKDVFTSVPDAMEHLARNLDEKPIQLDHRKYVGFVLADQLSAYCETVLDRIGDLTDVMFVGGFAGDDYKFDGSHRVFYQGRDYNNAVVAALWKPARGFALLKTQAAELTDTSMVITRADEQNRVIWEFDGEDAAAAYARVADKPLATMNILDFDESPLALTAEGEPYLRAIVKVVDNKGLQMFSRVREGTRMTLTRAGDVLSTTRAALEAKMKEFGEVSAILHINCSSRHTALKKWDKVDEFARLFSGIPSIAVSSYGEVYVGPVAITSTMILFK